MNRMKRRISIIVVLAMILNLISAFGALLPISTAITGYAEDTDPNGRYITMTGAGLKNGTSWENAYSYTNTTFRTAWDNTPSNGTLYIGSGTYNFTSNAAAISVNADKGGQSAAAPKRLVGVDRGAGKPVIKASFDPAAKTGTSTKFFDMAEGVSYVSIENIRLDNFFYGIRTAGNATDISIKGVDVYVTNDAIYLNGGGTSADAKKLKNVIVEDSTFFYYTKSGIRTVNRVEDVLVSRCYADAGGEAYWYEGNWPVGFRLTGTLSTVAERRITFVDCIAMNSYHNNGTGYWNSDGFSAERGSYDINYIRCKSFGATDGGWDVKSYNVSLTDCIAMDNKKNFRFWSYGLATMTNCLAAYSYKRGGNSNSVGLWASGNVVANFCTFFNNQNAQIDSDGTVVLNDCIVGANISGKTLYSGSGFTKNRTVDYLPGGNENPQINVSDSIWFYGDSAKYNSKYGNQKGYFWDPNAPIPTVAPVPTDAPPATFSPGITQLMLENFEDYEDSFTLQTEGSFDHTAGNNNLTLGTDNTKYGIVYSGNKNSYCEQPFWQPVPLNASAGPAPGRNAKLVAELKFARGSFNGGNGVWASFTDSSITANSTSATGAMAVGSRMQSAAPYDTALFRYSTNLTSVPSGTVLLAGPNDEGANGTWIKVRFVVSITDEEGVYLPAPKVDIYVNDSATPALAGANLLNAANKIDALRLGSSSSYSYSWVDDVNVYLDSETGSDPVPTPEPATATPDPTPTIDPTATPTPVPTPTPVTGIVYFEDFEGYTDSADLRANSGFSGTSAFDTNVLLGTNHTKYLSVKPSGVVALVTFAPVPLNAAGGQSPGKNAKLIAEHSLARANASDSSWHYFAFADKDLLSTGNRQTGAAFGIGHRPSAVTNEGQWLYRSSFTENIAAGTLDIVKDGVYSASAGQWTTVKYVVTLTDENGDFITPSVDIYMDGSAMPVKQDMPILNNVNKVDCFVINSVSGSKVYYADDISVEVTADETQQQVDKTLLWEKIQEAKSLYDVAAMIIGSDAGQYQEAIVTALNAAIIGAEAVYYDPDATQEEVDQQVLILQAVIEACVPNPSTATPAPTAGGIVYSEDFEDYTSSEDLRANSGWTGTTNFESNVILAEDGDNQYLSVLPNQTAAKVTFDPVPLKASAGESPGADAKLIATYRIARKYTTTGWNVFAFIDQGITQVSANNVINAGLAAGHRPATETDEGQWLYRSSFTSNIAPGNANEIKGGTYSDSAGEWTTVKYVVALTNAEGAFITPTVDIYVDNSDTPVLSGKGLLNNIDKIDALMINCVSSTTKIYYIDDIEVKIVLGDEPEPTVAPTPVPTETPAPTLPPFFDDLHEKIEQANTLYASVVENIGTGEGEFDPAVVTALYNAILHAQAVYDDPESTGEEIDAEIIALQTAIHNCVPNPATATPQPTAAPDPDADFEVTIGTVAGQPGTSVVVPVSITKMARPLAAAIVTLNYDHTKLTLTSIEAATTDAGGIIPTASDLVTALVDSIQSDGVVQLFYFDNVNAGTLDTHITTPGLYANLTFDINEDAETGMLPITLSGDTYMTDTDLMDDFNVSAVNGAVTVIVPTPVPEFITSSDENIIVDQETKKITYPHYKVGTANYHQLAVIKSKLAAASGYTYELVQSDGVTVASGTYTEPTHKVIVSYEGTPVATYTFIGKIQYGDVNGDGAITASDLGLMKRYLMNKTANPFVKPYGLKAADVNKQGSGSNTVTATDLGLLKRYLMSKTSYPISAPTEFIYDPVS